MPELPASVNAHDGATPTTSPVKGKVRAPATVPAKQVRTAPIHASPASPIPDSPSNSWLGPRRERGGREGRQADRWRRGGCRCCPGRSCDETLAAPAAAAGAGLSLGRGVLVPALQAILQDEKSGPVKTVITIFISFVGAGVLGLPYAFLRSGYVMGTTCLLVVSAISLHCMLLLLQCKRRLEDRGMSTYSEVCCAALPSRRHACAACRPPARARSPA